MLEPDYSLTEMERKGRKEYLVASLSAYRWGELTLEELEDIYYLLGVEK